FRITRIDNGKQRGKEAGKYGDEKAGAMAVVEGEYDNNAGNYTQAEKHFESLNAFSARQRFDYGRPERCGGKAGEANRNISHTRGSEECDPVGGDDGARKKETRNVLARDLEI